MKKKEILLLGVLVACLASCGKDDTDDNVPDGKAAERIYFDETTGALQLTKDPTNLGLYFKFGSVVGIATGSGVVDDNDDDDFDPTDVVFNPTTTTITGWGGSYNGLVSQCTLPNVPSYSSDDWNARKMNVSDAGYHTVDNLKAGKGDPCKLVSYTIEQIKAMLANNQLPDNKKWRLPTNEENATFVGSSSDYPDTNDWGTIGNVNGRYFPKGSGNTGSSGVFLPAAGGRNYYSGTADTPEDPIGFYWSSTATNGATYGYGLGFDSGGVGILAYSEFSSGFSVRCVPQ